MRSSLCLLAGAFLLSPLRATPSAAGEPAATVLKWEGSYWRYLLVLRPPEHRPIFKDRRGRTVRFLRYYRGWHIGSTRARVRWGEVPKGWMQPGFDDSRWVRRKNGPLEGGYMYDPAVRVACLRGRFEVPDPSKVTGLEFEVRYTGGVAVYLNGKEVKRESLPAGKLTGDTLAEAYPPEAYKWGIPINKHNYPANMSDWKPPSEKARRFRSLKVSLDRKLLVRGTNVLGFAIHRAGYNAAAARWSSGAMNGYRNLPWSHLIVLKLALKASPAGAVRRPERPRGVQLWNEDIHRRVVNRDWGEPGTAPVIRIVGARNGAHSGQVVVGSSSALAGLSARMSDLEKVGGAGKIPAAAVQVRYALGTPLDDLPRAWAYGRRTSYEAGTLRLLGAYALDGRDSRGWGFGRSWPGKDVFAEGKTIALFDRLAAGPPASVPANGSQPIWVTVRVPRDAPAGQYRGTLTVRAGKARKVEVRLQVMDWTLPDGRDLGTFVGLRQSLNSACARYKCAPWSAEHWKHLERSVKLLSEVGNDLAVIPLVTGGEAANKESLVPWIKKGAGYDYDWKNLDRYLDLVAKYWGKDTSVVCELGWTHSGKRWKVTYRGVTTLEGGTKGELKLPPAGSEEWKKLFVPFAKAVSVRLKARGFKKLYWGWFYDYAETVRPLAEALMAECPGVGWARASHNGFGKRSFPKGSKAANLDMAIRTGREPFTRAGEPVSRRGWKNPGSVLFPRIASSVQAIGQFESPMALRWLPENCLVYGTCGFGRMGADYWPPFVFSNWYHPFQTFILYPGPGGAEGSVRFEALREGLQEAEVRIQLERAGKDGTEPARTVLADRIRVIGALPAGDGDTPMCEYYGGWQERSWDLYAVAATAAGGRAPGAAEKARFFANK